MRFRIAELSPWTKDVNGRSIRLVFVSLVQIGILLVGSAWGQDDPRSSRLRVLTYNIHHGEGLDGRVDLERIATVIRDAKPDLVALQEVDKQTERTGKVDQTIELARLTQMHGLFGKQIPYEGGEYGQAILSRFPLSTVTVHWLPGEPDRERRITAAAVIDTGVRKFVFASSHLHHRNSAFRERQADALGDVFQDAEHPVILAGDLNAQPDSQVLKIMERRWVNATAGLKDRLTSPLPTPSGQIDYVLSRTGSDLTVVNSEVIDEKVASDHLPLLVEFSY